MRTALFVVFALVAVAAVVYLLHARGPLGLRAARDAAFSRPLPNVPPRVLAEEDLAALPTPVARYVRRSGAVGQPVPVAFRATWRGRIRFDAASPWMPFVAEQQNVIDEPRRTFFMDATMKGLPVDVLHVFDERGATMRAKVLSLFTVVDGRGPEMDRGETVTGLNDLVLLAPGALLHPSLVWTPVDDRRARVRYTLRTNTVSAELVFDDQGDLVDFVSDDRLRASEDGSSFTPMRWSTPVREPRVVGPARVATRGEAVWHAPAGAFAYGELELLSLAYER